MLAKGLALMIAALWLTGCSGGASAEDQAAAQNALTTWKSKQPTSYSFILTPTGEHPGSEALISVENDVVIDVAQPSGAADDYAKYTMTAVLEETVAASREYDRFRAGYDPELGFLMWYDVPPEHGAGDGVPGYGLSVRCLAPSMGVESCAEFL
jgi:hypothetical protein